MKDKIILVFYVGCANLKREEVPEYLNAIHDSLLLHRDNSVEMIFVPCLDEIDTRIECINPKLVEQDAYDEVMKLFENLKTKTEEIIETLKNKTNE